MWPDLTQAVVIQPKLNFAFLDGFCIGPCTFKHECVCVCVDIPVRAGRVRGEGTFLFQVLSQFAAPASWKVV